MGWKNLFGKKNKEAVPAENEIIEPANLDVVVLSDLGNIRTNNEDIGLFFKVADGRVIREKGYLLLVADGMGGHQAGEVASGMAAEIISREYFNLPANGDVAGNLSKVFMLANKKIFEKANSAAGFQGMGTTCTAMVLIGRQLYYAHVGDSRAYIIKDKNIHQVTQDHTYVQELVNNGEITAAEAATHPKRNILTNAMGTKATVRVDAGKCSLNFENNDRLLLCSDGLYDYLEDAELNSIAAQQQLKTAAQEMIGMAKQRGGHDNITVVLAEKLDAIPAQAMKTTRDTNIPQTKAFDLP